MPYQPWSVTRFTVALALSLLAIACGSSSHGNPQNPTSAQISYTASVDLTSGQHPDFVIVADFNMDGKPDIAVSTPNAVSVFLNQGGNVFSAPIDTAVQGSTYLGNMVSGDFNGDGKSDLLIAPVSGTESVIVLLGNGDGTFTQGQTVPNSFSFLLGRVADVNSDGHLDLIACGNGNMGVVLGNGDGTFQAENFLPNGPMPNSFDGCDVADFNSDGKLDILGANFTSDPSNLDVFLGDGTGGFSAPTTLPSGNPEPVSISAADFNGDGKPDVLVGFQGSTAAILLNNGNGTFGSPFVIYGTENSQSQGTTVLAADLNQDGKPDAIVSDYSIGVLTIKLNSGAGITAQSQSFTYTLAPGLSSLAVGDLNGDGILDIAVTNIKTNEIKVFMSSRQ